MKEKEIDFKLEREDVVHFVVRKLNCFVDNITKFDVKNDDELNGCFGVHISNKKGFEASLLLSETKCEVNVEKGSIDKDIEKLWFRHIFVTLHKGDFSKLFDEELAK